MIIFRVDDRGGLFLFLDLCPAVSQAHGPVEYRGTVFRIDIGAEISVPEKLEVVARDDFASPGSMMQPVSSSRAFEFIASLKSPAAPGSSEVNRC